MTHHRCTGCKGESYPRHKYKGGVFCDSCIRWIRGFRPHTSSGRSWLGALWDRIVDFATSVFQGKKVKRVSLSEEKAAYSRSKAMATRARSVPMNPAIQQPQKR